MDFSKERWKPISGFDGRYLVSESGVVYSVLSGIVLKQEDCRGYKQVTLYGNGCKQRMKVHRIVAFEFVENPFGYKYVNHKDENKSNNSAYNLEWCTSMYNNLYGTRIKRVSDTAIKNASKRKGTRPVLCVETGEIYVSAKDAERKTGICHSHISKCCAKRDKYRTAGGYSWEYADGTHS